MVLVKPRRQGGSWQVGCLANVGLSDGSMVQMVPQIVEETGGFLLDESPRGPFVLDRCERWRRKGENKKRKLRPLVDQQRTVFMSSSCNLSLTFSIYCYGVCRKNRYIGGRFSLTFRSQAKHTEFYRFEHWLLKFQHIQWHVSPYPSGRQKGVPPTVNHD